VQAAARLWSRPVPWDRVVRWAALALAALFFLTSLSAYLADVATHAGKLLTWYDLNVYNDTGLILTSHHLPAILYTWELVPGVKFTYTPFAALVFAGGTYISWSVLHWAMTVLSLLAIPLAAWLTLGAMGRRGPARAAAALAVGALALWTEPVIKSLQLGQIEPLLLLLVVWDLSQKDERRWKGAGIGLAAGIKLVPLIFIPYLLLAGKIRQAAVAAGTFAVTIIVGFIVLPGPSVSYWITGYFVRPGRTGGVDSLVNQSLLAFIARLAGGVHQAQSIWLAVALAVTALALVGGAALTRAGKPVQGWVLVGVTSVLVSPISWDHHWVWIVPVLAMLAGVAMQRPGWIRWASVVLLVAIAVVYGAWPWWYTGPLAFVPERGFLAWAVQPPLIYEVTLLHGWQLLTWNLFVAVGAVIYLGLLVFAALAWRRRPRSRPQPPQPALPATTTDALLARAAAVLDGRAASQDRPKPAA
jgi:alpha-1,2-mannosyltransferase